jgi:hypothetical protein
VSTIRAPRSISSARAVDGTIIIISPEPIIPPPIGHIPPMPVASLCAGVALVAGCGATGAHVTITPNAVFLSGRGAALTKAV